MAGTLTWSQSIAIGGTFDPLTTWQYRYVPLPGVIRIIHRATLPGLLVTITSGSDTLQQESPVQSGGTAGDIPSAFDTEPILDEVASGDVIIIQYRNTNVAANQVDGFIEYK